MAGYVSKNLEQFRSIGYDALLYCKTNIAGYFFDGYLDVSINSELEITSHPVETGASIADHAYLKPQEITMTVLMSDVHESLVPGQFTGGWSRSVTAYNVLKKIQSDRITVSVLTRLGLFKNMILKSVIADDTDIELFGLRARVTLVELPVARVRTVEISEADQTTIQTEMGNIASTYPNDTELESILSMIACWISGGAKCIRIPLTNYPNQTFSTAIPINGVNRYFVFNLWYNYQAGYWLMTITDQQTEQVLVSNIPLLSSTYNFSNLLRQMGYKNIGECYIAPLGNKRLSMPDNTNIDTDFVLCWGDNNE